MWAVNAGKQNSDVLVLPPNVLMPSFYRICISYYPASVLKLKLEFAFQALYHNRSLYLWQSEAEGDIVLIETFVSPKQSSGGLWEIITTITKNSPVSRSGRG